MLLTLIFVQILSHTPTNSIDPSELSSTESLDQPAVAKKDRQAIESVFEKLCGLCQSLKNSNKRPKYPNFSEG